MTQRRTFVLGLLQERRAGLSSWGSTTHQLPEAFCFQQFTGSGAHAVRLPVNVQNALFRDRQQSAVSASKHTAAVTAYRLTEAVQIPNLFFTHARGLLACPKRADPRPRPSASPLFCVEVAMTVRLLKCASSL